MHGYQAVMIQLNGKEMTFHKKPLSGDVISLSHMEQKPSMQWMLQEVGIVLLLKNTLFVAAETEFDDAIAILTKIGQHKKTSSLIAHKLMSGTHAIIKKLKLLTQEVLRRKC